jgi:hypothetical protein
MSINQCLKELFRERVSDISTYINALLMFCLHSNRFLDTIYDFLRSKAEEIQVGGIPSVHHRITSYMKYILKKKEFGNNGLGEGLEYVNDIPIWLYLYLLIRCGKSDLALEFVLEKLALFQQSAPDFPRYLSEYLIAPNRM